MDKPAEKSVSQKKKEVLEKHPVPLHLQAPSPSLRLGRLRQTIFKVLCICSYGQPSLDSIWAAIKLEEEGDESIWTEGRRRTAEQQNNILVLAGLLLATSAVFITTPPPDTTMLDYTRRGPYMCICGAFGLLMGGIIVTSICIIVTSKITASHTGDVLFGNTLKVYCTLIIISYPSVSIGVATLLLAFGILAAAWCAKDIGFQLGGMFLLILPILTGVLFVISNIPVPKNVEPQGNGGAGSFLSNV